MAILASGPSMSREVAEHVRGKCRVIAISDQGIDTTKSPAVAPWADVLYSADVNWWTHHRENALKFAGLKVTVRQTLKFAEVFSLLQSEKGVFDERPTHIVTGKNSGYQALHIAAHFGATRVLLCGYDMRNVGGKRHWFGPHPRELSQSANFSGWIAAFNALAPVLKQKGIEVLNCTPQSALECFRRVKLEDAI